MNRKSIYLANPYGFSTQQKDLLKPIIEQLHVLGLDVLEPFSRNKQVDFSSPDWAYTVGQRDIQDVEKCDAIFAVLNGEPSDVGVVYELAYAHAKRKKIFLFRDDFRKCNDSERYPLNLMLFTSLPRAGWESYYYNTVESITDTDKALALWAKRKYPFFPVSAMYSDYTDKDW